MMRYSKPTEAIIEEINTRHDIKTEVDFDNRDYCNCQNGPEHV